MCISTCYACGHTPESAGVDIDPEHCPDSLNLLALVLARATAKLIRLGLDRDYVIEEEVTPRLRGRILVAESRRRMVHRQAKMICRFDELSVDILPNRILRSTVDRLLRTEGVQPKVRVQLRLVQQALAAISPVVMRDALFARIRLHRNNRRYGLPLAVCRLVHRMLMPSERRGSRRFHEIFVDELAMPKLFEDFVRNFANLHFPESTVSAKKIRWHGEWSPEVAEILPGMHTDVTLEHAHAKIILDCKYYRKALVGQFEKKRMHSAHLYQLTAYLRNQAVEPGWESVAGVLLYPAVDHRLDARLRLGGQGVRVVSIDLDRPWPEIHDALVGICGGDE